MNDYETTERKQGVVMNFSSMPPEVLAQMIRDLNLSMSVSDLSFCKYYFSSVENRFPTLEEIYFLDAIIRYRTGYAESYRIARTNRGTGTLIATYEDFLQKAALFPRKLPMLAPEAAEIATKYLERIGAGRDLSRIAREENTKQKSAPMTFPPETAFLLLLPTAENQSYAESVQRFLADPSVQYRLRGILPISEGGLALTLAQVTEGIFADLSRFCEDQMDTPSLSLLCEDFLGKHMIAALRADCEWLTGEAERFALRAVYFAKATASKKFALSHQNNPYLNMDLAFLRALENGTQDGNFYLPEQNGKHSIFYRTMYDAISTVWLSTASKHARRDVSLQVAYRFPSKKVAPDALGQNFSAILGVYRALIELCIPAVPRVEFADELEEPLCTVAPFAPLHTLPEKWTQWGHTVYAIPLEGTPDGLPLFDRCRAICDSLTQFSREGKITAVTPISGTIRQTLSAMENGFFCQTECEEALLDTPMHGIVLESSVELPFLRIGRIMGNMNPENDIPPSYVREEPIPQASRWDEETL